MPSPSGFAKPLNRSRSAGAYAPEWVHSTADLWLERAGQQFYRAKSGGRNRTSLEQLLELSVSTEEKGLLFGQPGLDEVAAMGTAPGGTSDDAQDNVTNRVNA